LKASGLSLRTNVTQREARYFNVNEILTTLMLTYASVYLLNYLLAGPYKSPTSMGQPQTVLFSADQSLPYLIPGTIVQLNVLLAVIVLGSSGYSPRSCPSRSVVGSARMRHAMRVSADRTISIDFGRAGGLPAFSKSWGRSGG
jgi:simple sugar transport system permease protein